MISLDPGGEEVFSLQNATVEPTAGTTFALPAVRYGSGAAREITVEYIQDVAPVTVAVQIEAGNSVDANENLQAPLESIVTINTLGDKSIRVNVGRYQFVRANLTTLTGASAEVSVKVKM